MTPCRSGALSLLPAALLLGCAAGDGAVDGAASVDREHRRDAGVDGEHAPDASARALGGAAVFTEPAGLTLVALPGGNGVLEAYALTLRLTATGPALYAALRNVGDAHACSAGFAVELFDAEGRSLAAAIGGLLSERFYRRVQVAQDAGGADDADDGAGDPDVPGAVAACVGPGEVTMAALTDLPRELVLGDVATVVYRCPYFALDVVPIEGPSVTQLVASPGAAGTVYAGTLGNPLEVPLRTPSVHVFPLDGAGRPLGVAIASGDDAIAPGASWRFETDAIDATGVDQRAYVAGGLGSR